MTEPRLHRKPFAVALCCLMAGALMQAGGPLLMERTGGMGYYALVAY